MCLPERILFSGHEYLSEIFQRKYFGRGIRENDVGMFSLYLHGCVCCGCHNQWHPDPEQILNLLFSLILRANYRFTIRHCPSNVYLVLKAVISVRMHHPVWPNWIGQWERVSWYWHVFSFASYHRLLSSPSVINKSR